MRDLSLVQTVPSKEELRANIPRRERFQPEPRLLEKPQVRVLEDGTGELFLPRKGTWKHIHQLHVETVRAMAEGDDLARVVERAKPFCPPKHVAHTEKFVRRFVWMLHKEGLAQVPLEAPPAVFAGRYRWLRELGRGGMGVAHLCADSARGDEPVVVKHAWGWHKPIERAERSVREEARALARLDHPRIPPIVDAFEAEGLLHLVRAYAPGTGLHAYKPKLSEIPSAQRLAILRECADTLAHVHDRGMLYMDVKPENFVMDSIERGPFLLDTGLCRDHAEGALKLRGAIGSPGVVAPEVVKQHVATFRSDVYGLGRSFVLLATAKKLRYKHREPDVLQALEEAHVPDPERSVLARMCADDPAKRFADMREVIAAIP